MGKNPDNDKTYYYRTVSHRSLAISQERSFITLGAKIEEETPAGEEIFEEQPSEEIWEKSVNLFL